MNKEKMITEPSPDHTVHSRKVGNTWLKDSTDYCGSLILQNGAPSMYQFAGGYISFSNSALSGCHYYIQDYLGNNRMVVNKTDAVEQTTHYYPYGGVIGGIALNPGFQKYKFGGKELDRSYGLDWYDVQARQYDPVVPSWHTIDPLAEKYYCISPYAYCVNNPVMYFDPDGKWSWDSNGNLVAQKGDDVNTMANYLGTSSSNALQILDRCGIKANSEGILNLSAGQILNKTNLWVGTKSKNGSVVNNTAEAIAHYYLGNGKAADVGDQSTKELLSSEKFQSELNTITTTKVKSKGSFSVDMTDKTFHIGRTIVDYKITSNGTSNSVTFTLFANDGFWDPDFIDEKNLGEKFGIPFFQPDGMGPNLERGGTPYPYKTRSRTFFFKPTE